MNTTAAGKIPPITMSKLYIGNLPSETNENALRQLFLDQNLSCTNILVKRGGYAFVDCPDQSSADKAIDKLNGKDFFLINSNCYRLFVTSVVMWI
jgi:RNA recognition motif-containing protein